MSPSCDQRLRAYVPLPDNDHRTEFFSADRFHYEAERDVYICPTGKELRLDQPHSRCAVAALSGTRQGVQSLPAQSRVYQKSSRDEPSVAVCMKTIWIGCGPTMPPNPTRKPTANAVSGSNRYLPRRKTGMAYAAFGCACTGLVNREALRIAAGQNLKRLLKKRGWGRRPFPIEALCAFFLAAFWWMTRPSLAQAWCSC